MIAPGTCARDIRHSADIPGIPGSVRAIVSLLGCGRNEVRSSGMLRGSGSRFGALKVGGLASSRRIPLGQCFYRRAKLKIGAGHGAARARRGSQSRTKALIDQAPGGGADVGFIVDWEFFVKMSLAGGRG